MCSVAYQKIHETPLSLSLSLSHTHTHNFSPPPLYLLFFPSIQTQTHAHAHSVSEKLGHNMTAVSVSKITNQTACESGLLDPKKYSCLPCSQVSMHKQFLPHLLSVSTGCTHRQQRSRNVETRNDKYSRQEILTLTERQMYTYINGSCICGYPFTNHFK